ncbi:MAG: acetate--CoA ligase family protein [Candidatus Peribacteria bacterium]|nr:MAG: acetate--CoA ligase family protein [Candidatus Peribacteria bacterium]
MLGELRGSPILAGVRGEAPIDFEKLIDTIFKMQTLFHEFPQIQEIDINPIIVTEHDVWVVDVKMYV